MPRLEAAYARVLTIKGTFGDERSPSTLSVSDPVNCGKILGTSIRCRPPGVPESRKRGEAPPTWPAPATTISGPGAIGTMRPYMRSGRAAKYHHFGHAMNPSLPGGWCVWSRRRFQKRCISPDAEETTSAVDCSRTRRELDWGVGLYQRRSSST